MDNRCWSRMHDRRRNRLGALRLSRHRRRFHGPLRRSVRLLVRHHGRRMRLLVRHHRRGMRRLRSPQWRHVRRFVWNRWRRLARRFLARTRRRTLVAMFLRCQRRHRCRHRRDRHWPRNCRDRRRLAVTMPLMMTLRAGLAVLCTLRLPPRRINRRRLWRRPLRRRQWRDCPDRRLPPSRPVFVSSH
jgi:hypothetical protein